MHMNILSFIGFLLLFAYAKLTKIVPTTTVNLSIFIEKEAVSITKSHLCYLYVVSIAIILVEACNLDWRKCNETHLILFEETLAHTELAYVSSTPCVDFAV